MEIWLPVICGILAVIIGVLSAKIYLMKKSLKEIEEKLSEKLRMETNTLIDISSRDEDLRRLADTLNTELGTLREERRRFKWGDKELKDAVTNISHDLRTPLTAVCGYLDLLKKEEKSETAAGYLDIIENRTQVMKELAEELFDYSLISSAEEEEKKERICLNAALEESIVSFYGAIKQKGIEPEIFMTERRIEKNLDAMALTRIFGNIINNAIKYSDGDLKVELKDDGTIVFSNSAKNLNSVAAKRLFDRFYTVETGRNSTGLGLSISKLLTERMGGKICAEYEDGRLIIIVMF